LEKAFDLPADFSHDVALLKISVPCRGSEIRHFVEQTLGFRPDFHARSPECGSFIPVEP
jgi:hypothetical protein